MRPPGPASDTTTGSDLQKMTEMLTREALKRLSDASGEPSWLAERRMEAFDLFEKLELPDPKGDEWRYTDVRGFDFGAYAAPILATSVPSLPDEVTGEGVIFTDFKTAAAEHPMLLYGDKKEDAAAAAYAKAANLKPVDAMEALDAAYAKEQLE